MVIDFTEGSANILKSKKLEENSKKMQKANNTKVEEAQKKAKARVTNYSYLTVFLLE